MDRRASVDGAHASPMRAIVRFLHAHRATVALLLAAAAVRAAVMVVYAPAVQQWLDAIRFARGPGWSGFFSDYWTPTGYAGFLRVLRLFSAELAFTIAAQHLLGMASGLLLVAAARHLGVPRPYHHLAGAVVWFGGDFIYFEHTLMSETLFIFAMTCCVYAMARVYAATGVSQRWLLLAQVAAAAAMLVRWNALFLLPLPAFFAFVRGGDAWRRRLRTVARAATPSLLLIGGYLALSSAQGYSGTSDMNGWMLYSRVAPFLDCAQTTVDDDHPALCETTPASQRYGPLYYSWEPASPARHEFELSPDASGYLLRLGLDAIRHQPASYAKAVINDAVRVFFWSFHSRPGHGQILGVYDFAYRDRAWEENLARSLDVPYDGVYVNAGSVHVLHDYQMLTRLRGWMMLAMLLIGVAGLFVARRGTRGPPTFVLAVVIGLWFLPILTFTWDFRYTLPGTAFLPLAALLAIPAWTRRRQWRLVAGGPEAATSDEASIAGVEGAAGDAEPLSAR